MFKFFVFAAIFLSIEAQGVSRRILINQINQNKSTWTAGENFPDDVTTEELKRLNGGLYPDPSFKLAMKQHKAVKSTIPETFSASENWPECSTVINEIRDQGHCGSCWAFASAEVMSDRLCIKANGEVKFQFSPQDLLECCPKCVVSKSDRCGRGGYHVYAFDFWQQEGIVSGGDYYTSSTGCKPYSGSAFSQGIGPRSCSKQCQSNYDVSYSKDKKYGSEVYQIPQNVEQIQMEIMENGPVAALYRVYEDFYNYKSGVYQHVTGSYMGNHNVKIVGWGTERNTPYWLVANSWGKQWGDLNGFFKIRRGDNHCLIEQYIVAGKSSSFIYLSMTSFVVLMAFINVIFSFQH